MADLVQAISTFRDSVCAIMRIHPVKQRKHKKQPSPDSQFQISIVGTAWCIVENKFLLTANHIFNNGQPRDASDLFFAFTVPQNSEIAYHIPVVSFHLEDVTLDVAIIEIDIAAAPKVTIPSVPVTFDAQPDGNRVLTCGFPAPEIHEGKIDQNGNWRGGKLFLKSHANEGIIAAQYEFLGFHMYELNVGWHHGESGGPIFGVDPLAAFALMQQYRNVKTPHGILPGPHRGYSLAPIEGKIRDIGATVI